MATRQGTALCCAEKMMVGRWYKLVAHEVGYDVPYNYTATFSASNNSVFLLFDTVYVKSPGTVTITATDMYGNTDSKTISLIYEPEIERTSHIIEPTSWDDLKTKVTACGENAHIKLVKKDYHFDITDVGYAIPSGCVIDLNGSSVYFTSTVNRCRMFLIYFDFIEIRNGCFINETDSSFTHSNMSEIITAESGYMCKLEHLKFYNAIGFNIGIGTWPRWQELGAGTMWGNYNGDGVFNGYISNAGELVASSGAYSSSEYLKCTNVDDRTFLCGIRNCWIPQNARVYDIAFYDENYNFIELKKNCEFYRKYKRPDNSVYWRTTIYQDVDPVVKLAGDDYCFFRMYGDGVSDKTHTGTATCVEEFYCSDLIAYTNESGIISVVGTNNDSHFNLIRCDSKGSKNAWSFDVEDAWNASCGIVLSHSTFRDGKVYMHGAQGMTVMSVLTDWIVMNSNPYSLAIINSAAKTLYCYSIRNYVVCANCSIKSIPQNTNTESSYTPYVSNADACGTYDQLLAKLKPYYNRYLV